MSQSNVPPKSRAEFIEACEPVIPDRVLRRRRAHERSLIANLHTAVPDAIPTTTELWIIAQIAALTVVIEEMQK